MFKYFESLIDPYTSYTENDTPPTRIWPFLLGYSQPFKRVFVLAAIMSVVVASIEVGLIYYMGRVVDLLGTSPGEFWAAHGTEGALVAVFVLVAREKTLTNVHLTGLDGALDVSALEERAGRVCHDLNRAIGTAGHAFAKPRGVFGMKGGRGIGQRHVPGLGQGRCGCSGCNGRGGHKSSNSLHVILPVGFYEAKRAGEYTPTSRFGCRPVIICASKRPVFGPDVRPIWWWPNAV